MKPNSSILVKSILILTYRFRKKMADLDGGE